MTWNKLSMRDRATYIKLGLDNGITDLNVIRDTYNRYAEGGSLNPYDNINIYAMRGGDTEENEMPEGDKDSMATLFKLAASGKISEEEFQEQRKKLASPPSYNIRKPTKLKKSTPLIPPIKVTHNTMDKMRNLSSTLTSSVTRVPKVSKAQVQEIADKQAEKRLNTWKPVIQSVDLGLNVASMVKANPIVFGAGVLMNGIQLADDIVTDEPIVGDATSLGFDLLGLVGSLNKLPTIKVRGRNINTDKIADSAGFVWNGVDSVRDIYDLGKFGKELKSTPNSTLEFKPFSK